MHLEGNFEPLNVHVRACLDGIEEHVKLSSIDREIVTLHIQKVAIHAHGAGVKDGLDAMSEALKAGVE